MNIFISLPVFQSHCHKLLIRTVNNIHMIGYLHVILAFRHENKNHNYHDNLYYSKMKQRRKVFRKPIIDGSRPKYDLTRVHF